MWTEHSSLMDSVASQWAEFAVTQGWSWDRLNARLEEREETPLGIESDLNYTIPTKVFTIWLTEYQQEKKSWRNRGKELNHDFGNQFQCNQIFTNILAVENKFRNKAMGVTRSFLLIALITFYQL